MFKFSFRNHDWYKDRLTTAFHPSCLPGDQNIKRVQSHPPASTHKQNTASSGEAAEFVSELLQLGVHLNDVHSAFSTCTQNSMTRSPSSSSSCLIIAPSPDQNTVISSNRPLPMVSTGDAEFSLATSDPDHHPHERSSHSSANHQTSRLYHACRPRYHTRKNCKRPRKRLECGDLGHVVKNCKEVGNGTFSYTEHKSSDYKDHQENQTIYSTHTIPSTDMTDYDDSNVSGPQEEPGVLLLSVSPPPSPTITQSSLYPKLQYSQLHHDETLASYPVMPFTLIPKPAPSQLAIPILRSLKEMLGEERHEPEPLLIDENGNVEVTLHRKRKGKKGKKAMYDLTPFLSY
jgi:hypothetical protein